MRNRAHVFQYYGRSTGGEQLLLKLQTQSSVFPSMRASVSCFACMPERMGRGECAEAERGRTRTLDKRRQTACFYDQN